MPPTQATGWQQHKGFHSLASPAWEERQREAPEAPGLSVSCSKIGPTAGPSHVACFLKMHGTCPAPIPGMAFSLGRRLRMTLGGRQLSGVPGSHAGPVAAVPGPRVLEAQQRCLSITPEVGPCVRPGDLKRIRAAQPDGCWRGWGPRGASPACLPEQPDKSAPRIYPHRLCTFQHTSPHSPSLPPNHAKHIFTLQNLAAEAARPSGQYLASPAAAGEPWPWGLRLRAGGCPPLALTVNQHLASWGRGRTEERGGRGRPGLLPDSKAPRTCFTRPSHHTSPQNFISGGPRMQLRGRALA